MSGHDRTRGRRLQEGTQPSPDKTYKDFARENESWDRRVKESIEKIEEAGHPASSDRDPEPTR